MRFQKGEESLLAKARKVSLDSAIVAERIAGRSQREIAKRLDIQRSTVRGVLSREDIQKSIDEITSRMVSDTLEDAYQNIHHSIKKYRTNSDKLEKDHGFKASVEVLKGVGVLPGHAQSITIQNITNSQTNVLSPMMQDLVRKHLGLPDPAVVDAEEEE